MLTIMSFLISGDIQSYGVPMGTEFERIITLFATATTSSGNSSPIIVAVSLFKTKFICFAVLKAYHPIRHKCFKAFVFRDCFVCTNG